MSSKAESFILTTDFATLKNDANGTTSIVLPGNISIGANTVYTQTADVVVGSRLGESRVRIQSSIEGPKYFLGMLGVSRTGTSSGSASPYTVFAISSRISSTTVRCTIMIGNPYGATLTGSATPETFTFILNTFISPVT